MTATASAPTTAAALLRDLGYDPDDFTGLDADLDTSLFDGAGIWATKPMQFGLWILLTRTFREADGDDDIEIDVRCNFEPVGPDASRRIIEAAEKRGFARVFGSPLLPIRVIPAR